MHLPRLENRIQSQQLHRLHDLARERVRYGQLVAHAPTLRPGAVGVEVERVEALVAFVPIVFQGGGCAELGLEDGRVAEGRRGGGVRGGDGGGGADERGGEVGKVLFGGIGEVGVGDFFDACVLRHDDQVK